MAEPPEAGGVRVRPLAGLAPGSAGTVRHVADRTGAGTAQRLRELGFFPGAEVAVLRRAPWGDPCVYRVAGCEISLRRTEAALVDVEVTAP